jgi:uncharacterized protein YutE (UPF0331/DUF86 family)
VPDLSRIIAFRNILVHGYAAVDDTVVWRVMQEDLPGFVSALTLLLGDDTPP